MTLGCIPWVPGNYYESKFLLTHFRRNVCYFANSLVEMYKINEYS